MWRFYDQVKEIGVTHEIFPGKNAPLGWTRTRRDDLAEVAMTRHDGRISVCWRHCAPLMQCCTGTETEPSASFLFLF